MDKLTMAHEWYLKQLEVHENASVHGAWQYADAMQAEADKRNKAEAAQKRKEIREILNADNTFVEREGQHFDDVADVCKTYSSSEWQPDWSQAPYADAWRMYGDGKCAWLIDLGDKGFKWFGHAPSFDYQGNWQDSLRKRPQ